MKPTTSLPSPAANRHPRRRLLPWLAGAGLLALVIAGLWPKPVPVEVATVARGDVLVTVNEEGMTRVKHRYVISTPVAGQLQRIDWKAGAIVEAGKTPLAVLESSGADFLDARGLAQAEARVKAAEAARAAAQAQFDRSAAAARLATADFERLRRLRDEQAISMQEFDAAEMRAVVAQQDERSARFAAQVSEYELQQARALLTRGQTGTSEEPLVVTSPVDGRILRVLQESGRVVPAGFPLMEVGDATDLELRIEVLSRDGVAIRPGARVLVEQWGGVEPLQARVRLVEPSAFTKISALGVEEQRVYVIADFVDPIEKRPTLGDSYRIEGRIVVWEGRDVLRAPAGAFFQRGEEWQTFVLRGGRAELVSVRVGRTNGFFTEVTGGLKEGDRVIVYPGDRVRDGVRVREQAID
ncbi:MAG TPA: HlyD family efflux transporter periplasmic adaptor subunit [Opitutus sp.]|nr:HlyD family efflux transporter periplasmic adaptor subunit [Opitutus sp.]